MIVLPNSSLISLLTYEEKGQAKIAFAYLKQLNDIDAPQPPYWAEVGTVIWADKGIKQWLAYGRDEDIEVFWNKLFADGKLTINGTEYEFVLPDEEEVCETLSNGQLLSKYLHDEIPQYLLEEKNLLFIEGYRKDETNKVHPIKPHGLYPEGFLCKKLNEGYRSCKIIRQVHYHFRGTDAGEDKEPTKMKGFVQGDLQAHKYIAEIIGEDGTLIGSAAVDKADGTFVIPLSSPGSKGSFRLKDAATIIDDYKYVLLKGTTLNMQLATNTFVDVFGREKMLTKKARENKKPSPFTWHKEEYINDRESQIAISDHIKSILDYLGPDILICDPYFFGKLPPDSDDEKTSYNIYMNAIFSSAVEYELAKLHFMGCWSRASSIANKNIVIPAGGDKKKRYFEIAEEIFKREIEQNKFEKYFPANTIELINSAEDFHNRYWFGLKKNIKGRLVIDDTKVMIITNSINGVYKSGEIDIIPCEDPLQIRRISSKYDKLLKNATERYTIA